MVSSSYAVSRIKELLLKGRISTVDLLVKMACFVKKKVEYIFSVKSSSFELVSARRSIVLILPLQ
jgi:hypothetical protein